MAATHPHVAIYTRSSKDRYGNAETCLDQEQLGRAYAAKVWPGLPVKVYSDPDLSAFRDDVYRPGYEALREAIKAGHHRPHRTADHDCPPKARHRAARVINTDSISGKSCVGSRKASRLRP